MFVNGIFLRCPRGFRYNPDLNVCDDVDECADDTMHDCLVREGQVTSRASKKFRSYLPHSELNQNG